MQEAYIQSSGIGYPRQCCSSADKHNMVHVSCMRSDKRECTMPVDFSFIDEVNAVKAALTLLCPINPTEGPLLNADVKPLEAQQRCVESSWVMYRCAIII